MQQLAAAHLNRTRFHSTTPAVVGDVVVVSVKRPGRHVEERCETVQLVEADIADHVTPVPIMEPPAALVDVDGQLRRSLRTFTGMGLAFDASPSTRAPMTPTPAAAPATMRLMMSDDMLVKLARG